MPDASTRSPARRTGGRSARVRAAVLAATVDELLVHGIDGLSVGVVAQRAAVHETTIYRRWGSKANLAVNAILHGTQDSLPDPDTGSLRDDLVLLLREIVAFVNTPLGALLLQLATRQDLPEYEAAREHLRAERLAAGSAVLRRARDRGELRFGLDHRLALETLIGPVHVRLLLTREPLDDAVLREIVDLVLPGITA